MYQFQGRIDFVFDITQAWQAFEGLGGPKKLYVGNFGHPPSVFPGPDSSTSSRRRSRWYDRYLKGTRTASTMPKVVIAKQGSATGRVTSRLPKPTLTSYVLPGRSVARRQRARLARGRRR